MSQQDVIAAMRHGEDLTYNVLIERMEAIGVSHWTARKNITAAVKQRLIKSVGSTNPTGGHGKNTLIYRRVV
mgnify:FL=1